MVGASLGFELGIASKFSLLCYAIAWGIWGLSIYYSKLWIKSRTSAITSMGFLALALVGFWWLFLPEPQPLPPTAREIAAEINKDRLNPASHASMQFVDQLFGATRFPLKEGQTAGVNFYFSANGPGIAHNVFYYAELGFVRRAVTDEEQARDIDDLFRTLYRKVNITVQNGEKGQDVFPGEYDKPFFSAIEKSLKRKDVRAFNQKKEALCAIARIEYDSTQWVERCVMFIPEQVEELNNNQRTIWNMCKEHNTSGVRRSGSLL